LEWRRWKAAVDSRAWGNGGGVFLNVDDRGGRGLTPRASPPRAVILALVGFVGLSLLVGAADATLLRNSALGWYLSLAHPPGTPPNWLFAPAWTLLYVTIGTAAWLIWRQEGAGSALRLWGWQIAANALWIPVFFGLHQITLALAVSVVLLVLVALTLRAFARLVPIAGWLMAPCLAWTAYAVYLNAGLWWINRI
jgi:benzodiazapine receptor